jgi:hypothetical protein
MGLVKRSSSRSPLDRDLKQGVDLPVQGFHLLSQDLMAGLLAEEQEQFADGTVDQPPFTDLLLTEGNEDNEDGGRPNCVVAVGSGWESGWRGIPNRCWSLFWRGWRLTGFAVPASWSSLTALFTIGAVVLRPDAFSAALFHAVWACSGVRPTSGRS